MGKKLLRIPIHRFEPGKPLKEDLFLELPRNGKNIRVLEGGDTLELPFLDKMRSKGIAHLCFSASEDDSRDPQTCEIYLQAATEAKTEHPALAPKENFNADSVPSVQREEMVASRNPDKSTVNIESEVRFDTKKEEVEEISIQKTNTEALEPEQRFSADSSKEEEPEQRFSADSSKEEEPEQRFSADSSKEEEPEFRFSSKGTKLEKTVLSGAKTKKEKEVEFRFSNSSDSEQTAETRIRGKKESALEEQEIKVFSAEAGDSPAKEVMKVKSLEQLKNAALEGKEVDLKENREQLIHEAKAQIAASNLESRIAELKIKNISDEKDEHKDEIQKLEQKLKKATAGKIEGDLEEDVKTNSEFLALEEEMKKEQPSPVELAMKIQQISDLRDLSSKKLTEAIKDEKIAISRTLGMRDAPQTITKLAAYLASSLGYSNLDFLADLGFGVIVQFQQRMGAEIQENALTGFPQRALSPNQLKPNSLIDDYQQILKFMEIYTTDPLIDFKEREFSKRIFERTLEKTKNSECSPDPISLSRWVNFVEKGPTLEVHSLCSKASAKAVKAAKDISII